MALGRNIERLRMLSKMGRPDVARGIGIENDQAIYALESRDSKQSTIALALSKFFRVPLDTLLTADFSMLSDEDVLKLIGKPEQQPTTFDINVSPVPIGMRPIPVISAIQAGALKEIQEPYPVGAGFDVVYTDDDLSRWAFALEIEGESMLPEFRPGDRIIIDPEVAPNPGDYVAAKNGKEEATFKKYRPRGIDVDGNVIFELAPLNEDYPTLRSDMQQLQVIGVMVEHRKKYRRR